MNMFLQQQRRRPDSEYEIGGRPVEETAQPDYNWVQNISNIIFQTDHWRTGR